jgi:2-polyprenyl-3-methyl-5-hydroxy-6-metoxy-1,4-benzoquinol methylase
MRDSTFKRSLVSGYVSVLEVKMALVNAVRSPSGGAATIDYEAYWRSRSPVSVQPRFEIILAAVAADDTLLDIGCGDGAMLEHMLTQKGGTGSVSMSASKLSRAPVREASPLAAPPRPN